MPSRRPSPRCQSSPSACSSKPWTSEYRLGFLRPVDGSPTRFPCPHGCRDTRYCHTCDLTLWGTMPRSLRSLLDQHAPLMQRARVCCEERPCIDHSVHDMASYMTITSMSGDWTR